MESEVQRKLKEFFAGYKYIEAAPKQTILRPSRTIEWIYYLDKGSVRQYILSQGEEISLHIFSPGAYFPMMLLLSSEENQYYFEAIDQVKMYKAPAQDVLAFIKSDQDITFDLLTKLSKGLTKLLLKSETTLYKDSLSRIISMLLFLANKLGKNEGEWTILSVPLTHADIASWAGIQRETASRQLEVLMQKGVISYDKTSIKVRIEALEHELT